MLHQINFESIEHTTRIVKKTDTKLIECFDKKKDYKNKYDKKSLLKTYKMNSTVENELKHLINVLDNHMPSVDKEIAKFKEEIIVVGLKNKQEQISCLLRGEDEDSSTIE